MAENSSIDNAMDISDATRQPHLLQHNLQTTAVGQQGSTNVGTVNNNNNNNNNNNREQILTSLLEVELREAASDYLTRTRRSYPIHYVFDIVYVVLWCFKCTFSNIKIEKSIRTLSFSPAWLQRRMHWPSLYSQSTEPAILDSDLTKSGPLESIQNITQ
ncbi:unnamed protein product [Rotaria sp. Silwood1]|nr:unnamed protein product [Rotaria sp. Silwood1]CAF1610731.1 unnamed protein product [Rotaria sp. Silwood1]CAF3719208.1 unnamed protein product [Rotaria sp. Silwood1]CAF3763756.1 unnamed protein product [Rotaria sp. Silwood1]CAF4823700.1 unnamed protein product [Rotaria sp. Silwood1]